MTNRAVPVWCMAADAGVFVTGLSLRALRGSACECYRMDTAQFPVARFQIKGWSETPSSRC
jgi:hypothetical protein